MGKSGHLVPGKGQEFTVFPLNRHRHHIPAPDIIDGSGIGIKADTGLPKTAIGITVEIHVRLQKTIFYLGKLLLRSSLDIQGEKIRAARSITDKNQGTIIFQKTGRCKIEQLIITRTESNLFCLHGGMVSLLC
jgi:hypothetical protein